MVTCLLYSSVTLWNKIYCWRVLLNAIVWCVLLSYFPHWTILPAHLMTCWFLIRWIVSLNILLLCEFDAFFHCMTLVTLFGFYLICSDLPVLTCLFWLMDLLIDLIDHLITWYSENCTVFVHAVVLCRLVNII